MTSLGPSLVTREEYRDPPPKGLANKPGRRGLIDSRHEIHTIHPNPRQYITKPQHQAVNNETVAKSNKFDGTWSLEVGTCRSSWPNLRCMLKAAIHWREESRIFAVQILWYYGAIENVAYESLVKRLRQRYGNQYQAENLSDPIAISKTEGRWNTVVAHFTRDFANLQLAKAMGLSQPFSSICLEFGNRLGY